MKAKMSGITRRRRSVSTVSVRETIRNAARVKLIRVAHPVTGELNIGVIIVNDGHHSGQRSIQAGCDDSVIHGCTSYLIHYNGVGPFNQKWRLIPLHVRRGG